LYLNHPLTTTQNFTDIVPGESLRRGVKRKRGIATYVIRISSIGISAWQSGGSVVQCGRLEAAFCANYNIVMLTYYFFSLLVS